MIRHDEQPDLKNRLADGSSLSGLSKCHMAGYCVCGERGDIGRALAAELTHSCLGKSCPGRVAHDMQVAVLRIVGDDDGSAEHWFHVGASNLTDSEYCFALCNNAVCSIDPYIAALPGVTGCVILERASRYPIGVHDIGGTLDRSKTWQYDIFHGDLLCEAPVLRFQPLLPVVPLDPPFR